VVPFTSTRWWVIPGIVAPVGVAFMTSPQLDNQVVQR
jgi:hypothetical protein